MGGTTDAAAVVDGAGGIHKEGKKRLLCGNNSSLDEESSLRGNLAAVVGWNSLLKMRRRKKEPELGRLGRVKKGPLELSKKPRKTL